MKRTQEHLRGLKTVFSRYKDKHEANYQSRQVMSDIAGDGLFLTEILKQHLEKPGVLNTLHYPVVSMDVAFNEDFALVANCWIPLPDSATNMSTKAIHHHGDMLLTTATAFGTGYEHWTFETPCVVDRDKEIYELKVLEREAHSVGHVAFVDAYIAHLPFYPPDLTITYALWSSRRPTTWKDKLKRFPLFQENSRALRDVAVKMGLAKHLELKVVEYFDFYPTQDGFKGIRNREEFERTSNADYLASLFHIIQKTGNESLAGVVRERINSNEKLDNPELVNGYLTDLESGREVKGRLSSGHFGIEGANFTKDEILDALLMQNAEPVSTFQ